MNRTLTHHALCLLLLVSGSDTGALAATAAPQTQASSTPVSIQGSVIVRDAAAGSIEAHLRRSFLEITEIARELRFTRAQYLLSRKRLEAEADKRKDELKSGIKSIDRQIAEQEQALKKLSEQTAFDTKEVTDQRNAIHCAIQRLRTRAAGTRIALQSGVPIEYENLYAKLELMEKWPAAEREIALATQRGQPRQRRWSDVEDIGFRTIEQNQEDDIQDGQQAIEEMKRSGLLAKPIEDAEITEYANRIGQNIARNSDLRVPLNITLLNSPEVNAFALPGGFLFINHGLLLEAQTEAQFAGVIAHEISHDVARHGHRLMKRATIASLIYQAAQIGALIFTGGAVGVGAYYALNYGFQGLGLILSLDLLGVSRDFELEADQLGVQYAWKSGYDPRGFIELFDTIAKKEGYVAKTSWFRTHPAFYDRIVESSREIAFLGQSEAMIENTAEFDRIRAKLQRLSIDLDKEEKNRPTLYKRIPGCEPEGAPADARAQ
jgi:Zn-dependent protease with chaperone function/uncharacterized coiled-coil protein SlyX